MGRLRQKQLQLPNCNVYTYIVKHQPSITWYAIYYT